MLQQRLSPRVPSTTFLAWLRHTAVKWQMVASGQLSCQGICSLSSSRARSVVHLCARDPVRHRQTRERRLLMQQKPEPALS